MIFSFLTFSKWARTVKTLNFWAFAILFLQFSSHFYFNAKYNLGNLNPRFTNSVGFNPAPDILNISKLFLKKLKYKRSRLCTSNNKSSQYVSGPPQHKIFRKYKNEYIYLKNIYKYCVTQIKYWYIHLSVSKRKPRLLGWASPMLTNVIGLK